MREKRGREGWSLVLLLMIMSSFIVVFPLVSSFLNTKSSLVLANERWLQWQRAKEAVIAMASNSSLDVAVANISYSLTSGDFEVRAVASPVVSIINGLNVQATSTINVTDPSGFFEEPWQAIVDTQTWPFTIKKPLDLDTVRKYPQPEAKFVIVSRIDLSSPSWSKGDGWVPIGNSTTPFQGNISAAVDPATGQYYPVDFIKISRPSADVGPQGLFGVASGAQITNIVLRNVSIAGGTGNNDSTGALAGRVEENSKVIGCSVDGTVAGKSRVGGLIGISMNSEVSQCTSNTAVTAASGVYTGGLIGYSNKNVFNCNSRGAVNGNNSVGGLIGNSAWGSRVENSFATGNVTGSYQSVGGLIGRTHNTIIKNCWAIGSAAANGNNVGGLVGMAEIGSTTHCFATGSVTGSVNSSYVGGLIGFNVTNNIENSFATGKVTGLGNKNYAGGLAGFSEAGKIRKCYAFGEVLGAFYVGGLVGELKSGEILQSHAIVNTTGKVCVGGLVGLNRTGVISESYASGTVNAQFSVAGGLVGQNMFSITDCHANGSANSANYAGGLVGFNDTSGTIANSYSTTQVLGTNLGGLVARNSNIAGVLTSYWNSESSGILTSNGGEARTTAQMRKGTPGSILNAAGNPNPSGSLMFNGWPDSKWFFTPTNDYPRLKRAYTLLLTDVNSGTFQRNNVVSNTFTVATFSISNLEISQQVYNAVSGVVNPSYYVSSTTNFPAERISWYSSLVFCNRLSISEGLLPVYTISGATDPDLWGVVPTADSGTWNNVTANFAADGYRLPTEAEWRRAALGAQNFADKNFAGAIASNSDIGWLSGVVSDYAWYSGNSLNQSHLVASALPNQLGIFNMSGNVREWVWDRFGSYPGGNLNNYTGATTGSARVVKGGGLTNGPAALKIAARSSVQPYSANRISGLRVVRRRP